MAEKTLKTRIQLKYDTLANWTDTSVAGAGGNLVLKKGELGIVEVPTGSSLQQTTPPAVMMKVGDGVKAFKDLPWTSALAADVYGWAKAATKPTYTASEVGVTTTAFPGLNKVGTVTSIKKNGSTLSPSNGVIDLGTLLGPTDLTDYQLKAINVTGITAKTVTGALAEINTLAGGKYSKPSTGIPASDLTQAVQDSLDKADSALQSHQTITLAGGTKNGTLKITVGGEATDNVAVTGLGSAAYTASTAYATKAQGDKADAALPKATYDEFIKIVNANAIANAAKYGQDAQTNLSNYMKSNDAVVAQHGTDISNLQTALKSGITFKGKLSSLPATTSYSNGDLIIVGSKEYILYEDTSASTKSWVELGDEGTHLTKTTADGYYVAKNTAIAGATKCKITYDSKGLVTAGADLTASDIPSLAASKITSGTFADARIASASTWNGYGSKITALEGKAGLDKVGTVTGIKMNGSAKTVASDGTVDLGTVITDVSGKQDKLSTTQLDAVNSGITSSKVTTYDGYASKISTLEGKKGLDKVGTVTSVAAGTGLKITGTASTTPTVAIDDAVVFVFDCGSSTENI